MPQSTALYTLYWQLCGAVCVMFAGSGWVVSALWGHPASAGGGAAVRADRPAPSGHARTPPANHFASSPSLAACIPKSRTYLHCAANLKPLQVYLLYHPELRQQGIDSPAAAARHYLAKGRAEGRPYKRLRVLLRYTACTGLINQHYSHIAAFTLAAALGAELVLPPAVCRDSFAHYFRCGPVLRVLGFGCARLCWLLVVRLRWWSAANRSVVPAGRSLALRSSVAAHFRNRCSCLSRRHPACMLHAAPALPTPCKPTCCLCQCCGTRLPALLPPLQAACC